MENNNCDEDLQKIISKRPQFAQKLFELGCLKDDDISDLEYLLHLVRENPFKKVYEEILAPGYEIKLYSVITGAYSLLD